MNQQLLNPVIKALYVILHFIVIFLFIKYSLMFLYPFLIACGISLLINPLVNYLEKKIHIDRTYATLLVVVSFFTILLSASFLVISEIIQGTSYLAENIPNHYKTFITFMEQWINHSLIPIYEKALSMFQILNNEQNIFIKDYLHDLTAELQATGGVLLKKTLLKITSFLSIIPESIATLIIIFLATFFITNDFYRIKNILYQMMPRSTTLMSKHLIYHIQKAFVGFFKAQFILISINAILVFIGLWLLKIEHALTIALLAAGIDILPLIGTGVIFIPWIIYLFFIGNYQMTISISVLYMIIVLVRQLLEPKILSDNVGLNPLIALMALFALAKLWGIVGVLLAPILLIIISAVHQAGLIRRIWRFILT